ncbi:hypothetical protein GIB67_009223 [Kingdonia uniflora]|uniref:No apical meristem-associated C-terminal domain-containing protein n=1 Tax=Kingdonia uniflora TaxID=39325 RepID=A0A7J7N2I8_9MAGN|nr:hypothetical protein GIB67_009223 [Kingdonia uniflora]
MNNYSRIIIAGPPKAPVPEANNAVSGRKLCSCGMGTARKEIIVEETLVVVIREAKSFKATKTQTRIRVETRSLRTQRIIEAVHLPLTYVYIVNYLFHGESTQHSQSDANASIPVEAAAPQKDKRKGRKKRAPAKQRPIVQVSEDTEFLDETDDAGMHWMDADFTRLASAWVTTSVNVNGRTKGFTFYQKGIVAQERFRNSSGKTEDRENDAHKIYKGLNVNNDFKYCEAYKILAWEPRWANLRDDGLNHAVNIPRNVARRTSDNSSLGNSVGSNNLSEDPDGPPTPQSAGPNSDLNGSLFEGGSRPIGQKIYRKNIASQKALEGVTASDSGVHALLDELWLEKMQANQEKQRRRVESIQYWQAKIDLEQAKEDHKIMEKDLSTLSGHQL